MKTFATILLLTAILSSAATARAVDYHAEPGDDTLSLLLSKSQLVVSGSITTKTLLGTIVGGRANYDFKFRIEDVIKGAPEMRGQTISVSFFVRINDDPLDFSLPLFQQNAKRILFLREPQSPNHGYWVQADDWFAIHVPNNWLVGSLKRLEREKAKD